MQLKILPLSLQEARVMATWRYESPYSIYSLSEEAIPEFINPKNRYFCVKDGAGQMIGYCCFGEEAKVLGGDYTASELDVIDVGLGMHPAKVGKGLGKEFIDAIFRFATHEFKPGRLRVTIAAFNLRSQKAFLKSGFVQTHRFLRKGDGVEFVQLERDVNWTG
jgi:ribosomal-protein-alanine N-acetyltransferase